MKNNQIFRESSINIFVFMSLYSTRQGYNKFFAKNWPDPGLEVHASELLRSKASSPVRESQGVKTSVFPLSFPSVHELNNSFLLAGLVPREEFNEESEEVYVLCSLFLLFKGFKETQPFRYLIHIIYAGTMLTISCLKRNIKQLLFSLFKSADKYTIFCEVI